MGGTSSQLEDGDLGRSHSSARASGLRPGPLVVSLQLLPTIVHVSAQHVLKAPILQLLHDLADLPARPQEPIDLARDRGRQLARSRILGGVGRRVIVVRRAGGDVVVDDPLVAVAERLDALELEGAVALLAAALGLARGLARLAVAGLAGAVADPADLALALAHVAGAAHAHRVAARNGVGVELLLHGGAAFDGIALGRDLHGDWRRDWIVESARGRGECLLLVCRECGAHGAGAVRVGKGHDGVVDDVDAILVQVLVLPGRRLVGLELWEGLLHLDMLELLLLLLWKLLLLRKLLLLLLHNLMRVLVRVVMLLRLLLLLLLLLLDLLLYYLLLLGLLLLDLLNLLNLLYLLLMLGTQGTLAGLLRGGLKTSDKTAFSTQQLFDVQQALVEFVEAVGDDEVDALVDDGSDGAGQGLLEVGRVWHEEGLVVWVGHGGGRLSAVRFRDRGASGSRITGLVPINFPGGWWVELSKRQSSTGLLEENTLQIRH